MHLVRVAPRVLSNAQAWFVAGVLGLAALAAAAPALAQSADELGALKAEIQALKAGQAAMQKDLTAIKEILIRATGGQRQARSEPSFEPQDLSIADAPYLGEATATVTLVEFTDYQCPFCRRHSAQTKPQLVTDYVETGKLKYVMREFPLAQIHPLATKASEAALCAGDQGQYFAMNEAFFADPRKLAPADLTAHAEALGLDVADFSECLDGGKYAERVQKDLADGAKAGVRGTPSFFLGLTDPEDATKIKAVKVLRGAQPYAVFKQAIDELVAEAAKGS
jgi:protein-disulfide isomerase